jgi:DNA-binding response OmpR family regulator
MKHSLQTKIKILLIEDDVILGETLKELLHNDNFEVVWVKDAKEGLNETFAKKFDLFLFDVNIPFMSGFELLKELRQAKDLTPAIFITANVDIDSLKKGFDVGADDYIKKPFEFEELVLRIKVAIKKSFKIYNKTIKYKNIIFDIESKKVFKDGMDIHLSPSQNMLLEYFLKNQNKIISKEELLEITHNNHDFGSFETLRVWISNLKKLGLNITNIRGLGYRCEKV